MEADEADGRTRHDATANNRHEPIRHAQPAMIDFWTRGFGFFGPILLFFLPILPLAILRPELVGPTMSFYAVAALLGVDVSVVAGLAAGLHWWYIFLWVMWGQMLLTAFLLWNLRFLRRWKRADAWFTRREARAIVAYERHAWLRKFHFWGLMFFTILPIGSGVYIGVLIGKYTGLDDHKTWLALMIGTAIWLFLLVYFGVHLWDRWIPHIRWT